MSAVTEFQPGELVTLPLTTKLGRVVETDERGKVLVEPTWTPNKGRAWFHPNQLQPAPADRKVAVVSLPGWDKLSPLDRGAALLHLEKRYAEGDEYAVAEYPCEYFDDLALCDLSPAEACAHAASLFTDGWEQACDMLGVEIDKLYDAALTADRLRRYRRTGVQT